MEKLIYLLVLCSVLLPGALSQERCYICNADMPGDCDTVEGVIAATCGLGAPGCFRRELENGLVQRGCASELTETQLNVDCAPGTQSCRICQGQLCNGKVDFQRCYRCESDNDFEDCSQLQTPVQNLHTCDEYLDECAVQVVGQRTLRGCRNELTLPETCNVLTCNICQDNFCNSAVFPANRLRCNFCSGTSDDCFDSFTHTQFSRVCNNFVGAGMDRCYTSVDAEYQVRRGCESDDAAVCDTNSNCEACFAANCNNINARNPPTLGCIACEPTDALCMWGFAAGAETSPCANVVHLGRTESCYQRLNADGTASRGCTLDVATPPCEGAAEGTCSTCERAGCNRFSYKWHQCYQCSERNNESCRNRAEEDLEPTNCLDNDHLETDRGCYMLFNHIGQVVRGCTRNLDRDLVTECEAGQRCTICREDGCNDEPAGAVALKITSLMVLLLVAVGVRVF